MKATASSPPEIVRRLHLRHLTFILRTRFRACLALSHIPRWSDRFLPSVPSIPFARIRVETVLLISPDHHSAKNETKHNERNTPEYQGISMFTSDKGPHQCANRATQADPIEPAHPH